MSKEKTKNTVKPHTEAKLQFYIGYLSIYLRVLLAAKFIRKINIYDLYCGAGVYLDGKHGSSIRAVSALAEIIKQCKLDNSKEVNIHLNDLDCKKIDDTRAFIKNNNDFDGVRITFSSESAVVLANKLKEGFSKQGGKTRNLVFIDPYGYKDIGREILEGLIDNGKTEIILFLPVEHMYRFKDKTQGESIDNTYLALKSFVDSFEIDVQSINSEKSFIKNIEHALSFNKKYFSTSYSIRNHTGHYYGMFFITSNLLGLEKTLEIKWKLDPQQGEGFSGCFQNDLLLELEKQDDLKNSIMSLLNRKEVYNNEMYEHVLRLGFLPVHANKILQELVEEEAITITSLETNKAAKKRQYGINHSSIKTKKFLIKMFE